jgi:antirestriction protein ArdC
VTIHHGGNRAFYAPAQDTIQMPPFEAFKDKESYYGIALHELSMQPKPSTVLTAISARSGLVIMATHGKN